MLWTDYQQPQATTYAADNLFLFNSHSENQNGINHAMSNISISALNGTCSTSLPLSTESATPTTTASMVNMSNVPSQPIMVAPTSTPSETHLDTNLYQTSFLSPPSTAPLSTTTDLKMLPATFYDPLLLQQQQQSQLQQFIQPPTSVTSLPSTPQPNNSTFLAALSHQQQPSLCQQQQQQQQPMLQYVNHPVLQTNSKPGRSDAFALSQSNHSNNHSTILSVAINDTNRREGNKPTTSLSIPFPNTSSSTTTSSITPSTSNSTRRGLRNKATLAVANNISSSSSEEKDDVEKRKNFLERNRQAALKCRQRKKQWLQSLQERVEFLANDNEQLHLQATVMRDEVLTLRNLLMAHKDCHFSEATKEAIINATNTDTTTSSPTTTTTASTTATDPAGYMADMAASSAGNPVTTTNNSMTPHLLPAFAGMVNTPVVNNLMIPITNDLQPVFP